MPDRDHQDLRSRLVDMADKPVVAYSIAPEPGALAMEHFAESARIMAGSDTAAEIIVDALLDLPVQ